MIIAIDGHAGAGKGTIAKYLSERFNYAYLDTGLLYRYVAWIVLEKQIDLSDMQSLTKIAENLDLDALEPQKLRTETIGNMASKIAVYPFIRSAITDLIRDFANHPPTGYAGVILDGRDIASVVYPNADCKLFITAHAKERAKRRLLQENPSIQIDQAKDLLDSLEKQIIARDERDSTRKHSPLIFSNDSFMIDTTVLTINQACLKAASIIENCITKNFNPPISILKSS